MSRKQYKLPFVLKIFGIVVCLVFLANMFNAIGTARAEWEDSTSGKIDEFEGALADEDIEESQNIDFSEGKGFLSNSATQFLEENFDLETVGEDPLNFNVKDNEFTTIVDVSNDEFNGDDGNSIYFYDADDGVVDFTDTFVPPERFEYEFEYTGTLGIHTFTDNIPAGGDGIPEYEYRFANPDANAYVEYFYEWTDADNDENPEEVTIRGDPSNDGKKEYKYEWVDADDDGNPERIYEKINTDNTVPVEYILEKTDTNDDGNLEHALEKIDVDRDGDIDYKLEKVDADDDGNFELIVQWFNPNNDGSREYVYQLTDSDDDGVLEWEKKKVDVDGDGIKEYKYIYQDNNDDGIIEWELELINTNDDSIKEYKYKYEDIDNDGNPEYHQEFINEDNNNKKDYHYKWVDSDDDGVPETLIDKGASTDDICQMKNTFTSQSTMTIKFSMMAKATDENFQVSILSGTTGVAKIRFADNGYIRYYDGSWTNMITYTEDTWYDFEILLDASTDTFDLYVDSIQYGIDRTFINAVDGVDKIIFKNIDTYLTGVYVDDIYYFSGNPYETSGYIISTPVVIPAGNAWNQINLDKFEPDVDNYIELSVLDGSTDVELLTGLTVSTIDISMIDQFQHPSLKLKADFTGNGILTPTLSSWETTWIASTGDVTIEALEDIEWKNSDSDIVIYGDLIVEGTLTLDGITLKMASDASNTYGIYVRDGGRLNVYDSTITAYNSEYTYKFEIDPKITGTEQSLDVFDSTFEHLWSNTENDFGGIVLESFDSNIVDTTIRNSNVGITFVSDCEVENIDFSNVKVYYFILEQGVQPTIIDTTIIRHKTLLKDDLFIDDFDVDGLTNQEEIFFYNTDPGPDLDPMDDYDPSDSDSDGINDNTEANFNLFVYEAEDIGQPGQIISDSSASGGYAIIPDLTNSNQNIFKMKSEFPQGIYKLYVRAYSSEKSSIILGAEDTDLGSDGYYIDQVYRWIQSPRFANTGNDEMVLWGHYGLSKESTIKIDKIMLLRVADNIHRFENINDDVIQLDLGIGQTRVENIKTPVSGQITDSKMVIQGDYQFDPPQIYSTNYDITDVLLDDFIGDFRLDTVGISRESDKLILYRNVNGVLQSPIEYTTESLPSAIISEDFNNNGANEIVIANSDEWTNSISIVEYSSVITNFDKTQSDIETGKTPIALATGDFDGDSDKDIITVNKNDNSYSYIENQGGVMQNSVSFETLFNPRCIASGDLNQDGFDDIIIGSHDGYITTYFGSMNVKSSGMNNGKSVYLKHIPTKIDIGLINSDSFLDIAVILKDGSNLNILLNDKSANLVLQPIYQTTDSPNDVDIIDVDNDSDLDIIISSFEQQEFQIFTNDGEGTFIGDSVYNVDNDINCISVGKISTDNLDDVIVITNSPNQIEVFEYIGYSISIDIGNDGSIEYNYNGPLGPDNENEFIGWESSLDTIRNGLIDTDGDGYVSVPIGFSSDLDTNFAINGLQTIVPTDRDVETLTDPLAFDTDGDGYSDGYETTIPLYSYEAEHHPGIAQGYSPPEENRIKIIEDIGSSNGKALETRLSVGSNPSDPNFDRVVMIDMDSFPAIPFQPSYQVYVRARSSISTIPSLTSPEPPITGAQIRVGIKNGPFTIYETASTLSTLGDEHYLTGNYRWYHSPVLNLPDPTGDIQPFVEVSIDPGRGVGDYTEVFVDRVVIVGDRTIPELLDPLDADVDMDTVVESNSNVLFFEAEEFPATNPPSNVNIERQGSRYISSNDRALVGSSGDLLDHTALNPYLINNLNGDYRIYFRATSHGGNLDITVKDNVDQNLILSDTMYIGSGNYRWYSTESFSTSNGDIDVRFTPAILRDFYLDRIAFVKVSESQTINIFTDESNLIQKDFTPANGFASVELISIPDAPVISGKITIEGFENNGNYPIHPSLDIGSDGIIEWEWQGAMFENDSPLDWDGLTSTGIGLEPEWNLFDPNTLSYPLSTDEFSNPIFWNDHIENGEYDLGEDIYDIGYQVISDVDGIIEPITQYYEFSGVSQPIVFYLDLNSNSNYDLGLGEYVYLESNSKSDIQVQPGEEPFTEIIELVDFLPAINDYIIENGEGEDVDVPFEFRTISEGSLVLSNLEIKVAYPSFIYPGQITDPLDLDTDFDGIMDSVEHSSEISWYEAEHHQSPLATQISLVSSNQIIGSNGQGIQGVGNIINPYSFIYPYPSGEYQIIVRMKASTSSPTIATIIANTVDGEAFGPTILKDHSITDNFRWYRSPLFRTSSTGKIMISISSSTSIIIDKLAIVRIKDETFTNTLSRPGQEFEPLDSDQDYDNLLDVHEIEEELYWYESENYPDPFGTTTIVTEIEANNGKSSKTTTIGNCLFSISDNYPYGSYKIFTRARADYEGYSIEIECDHYPSETQLTTKWEFDLSTAYKWYWTDVFVSSMEGIGDINIGINAKASSALYVDRVVLVRVMDQQGKATSVQAGSEWSEFETGLLTECSPGRITDPFSSDADFDSLTDIVEKLIGISEMFSDPLIDDIDHDNIPDNLELTGTISNPNAMDSDRDRIPDGNVNGWGWNEVQRKWGIWSTSSHTIGVRYNYWNADESRMESIVPLEGEDVNLNGQMDKDITGTYIIETHPYRSDSDGDGLLDAYEYIKNTNPLDADSDDDGVADGYEVSNGLDPLNADTDGDGIIDGIELGRTNPIQGIDYDGGNPDTYGTEGVFVGDLDSFITDPLDIDSDDDGLPDGWLEDWNFHFEDLDENGMYSLGERGKWDYTNNKPSSSSYITMFTNVPNRQDPWEGEDFNFNGKAETGTWTPGIFLLDTDGDGYSDLLETTWSTQIDDPTDYPSSQDSDVPSGFPGLEHHSGGETNAAKYDTDNGEINDGTEIVYNFDPIDILDDDDLTQDDDDDGIPLYFEKMYYGTEESTSTTDDDADFDDDGINDGDEVFVFETDPTNPDTDDDYLFDGTEVGITTPVIRTGVSATDKTEVEPGVFKYLFYIPDQYESTTTDPNNADTDGDGLPDGWKDTNFNNKQDAKEGEDFNRDGKIESGEWRVYPTDISEDGIYLRSGGETDPNSVDTNEDTTSDQQNILWNENPINMDLDSDGLINGDELNIHLTDQNNPDTDDDGLNDYFEIFTDYNPFVQAVQGSSPTNPDTDGDGLPDGYESRYYNGDNSMNPILSDTDGDGISDADETVDYIGLYYWVEQFEDDSLSNLLEYEYGTSPEDVDTDNDGLYDGPEVLVYSTDPFVTDTDGDGLLDGYEVGISGTDPTNYDTDNDGMPDAWEDKYGLNPNDASDAAVDTDNDGLASDPYTNLEEYLLGSHPTKPITGGYNIDPTDSDNDGIIDGWEAHYGLNPTDGIWNTYSPDAFADTDGDGLTNLAEYQSGGDPTNTDTDGDGEDDFTEVLVEPLTDPASSSDNSATASSIIKAMNGEIVSPEAISETTEIQCTIRFRSEVNYGLLTDMGISIIDEIETLNLVRCDMDSNQIQTLKSMDEISYIEYEKLIYIYNQNESQSTNHTQSINWNIDSIGVEHVWNRTMGDGVKIAILDTGIDIDHPDLVGNIAGGISFVGDNISDYSDNNGHGTHVAGIICAENNEYGVVGVAPNATIYSVKVLDENGIGNSWNIVKGIQWCIDNEIDIISMSFGSNMNVKTIADICYVAYKNNIILVAASGSDGDKWPDWDVDYPAAYNSTIAVGAVDSQLLWTPWSSDGKDVELCAPGVSIESTWINGGYHYLSGTSMATPHVTGLIALMLSENEDLSPDQIRGRLQKTAIDKGEIGHDSRYGFGLANGNALDIESICNNHFKVENEFGYYIENGTFCMKGFNYEAEIEWDIYSLEGTDQIVLDWKLIVVDTGPTYSDLSLLGLKFKIYKYVETGTNKGVQTTSLTFDSNKHVILQGTTTSNGINPKQCEYYDSTIGGTVYRDTVHLTVIADTTDFVKDDKYVLYTEYLFEEDSNLYPQVDKVNTDDRKYIYYKDQEKKDATFAYNSGTFSGTHTDLDIFNSYLIEKEAYSGTIHKGNWWGMLLGYDSTDTYDEQVSSSEVFTTANGYDAEYTDYGHNFIEKGYTILESLTSTDTDGDTLSDIDEYTVHNTDPSLADTDDDGTNDNIEITNGRNPTSTGFTISGHAVTEAGYDMKYARVLYYQDTGGGYVRNTNILQFTDANGDFEFLSDIEGIEYGADGRIEIQLVSSLSRDNNDLLFEVYDEAQWGNNENIAAGIDHIEDVESINHDFPLTFTADHDTGDITYNTADGGMIYEWLMKIHEFYEAINHHPPVTYPLLVEINDNDFSLGGNSASHADGNRLHYVPGHIDEETAITHEYVHLTIPWNPVFQYLDTSANALMQECYAYGFVAVFFNDPDVRHHNNRMLDNPASLNNDMNYLMAGVLWTLYDTYDGQNDANMLELFYDYDYNDLRPVLTTTDPGWSGNPSEETTSGYSAKYADISLGLLTKTTYHMKIYDSINDGTISYNRIILDDDYTWGETTETNQDPKGPLALNHIFQSADGSSYLVEELSSNGNIIRFQNREYGHDNYEIRLALTTTDPGWSGAPNEENTLAGYTAKYGDISLGNIEYHYKIYDSIDDGSLNYDTVIFDDDYIWGETTETNQDPIGPLNDEDTLNAADNSWYRVKAIQSNRLLVHDIAGDPHDVYMKYLGINPTANANNVETEFSNYGFNTATW